jgi:hypothetical protein
MSDPVCTCKPPTSPWHHESATLPGTYNKYAIRIDSWEDDSETDPACYYHGDHGTMVVRIFVQPPQNRG